MKTVYMLMAGVFLAIMLVASLLVILRHQASDTGMDRSLDQEILEPALAETLDDEPVDDADHITPEDVNAWARSMHDELRRRPRFDGRRIDADDWQYLSRYLKHIDQVDEDVRYRLLQDLRQLRYDIDEVLAVLPEIRDPEVVDYLLHAATRAGFSGKDWNKLMNAMVDMTHGDDELLAGVALIHAVKWPLINRGWSQRAMHRFADIIHGPQTHLREVAVSEGFNMSDGKERYADMHERLLELAQIGTWRERHALVQIIARWKLGDAEAVLEALVQDEHERVSRWAKTHLHFLRTGSFVLEASVGVVGEQRQRFVSWPGHWASHDRQRSP